MGPGFSFVSRLGPGREHPRKGDAVDDFITKRRKGRTAIAAGRSAPSPADRQSLDPILHVKAVRGIVRDRLITSSHKHVVVALDAAYIKAIDCHVPLQQHGHFVLGHTPLQCAIQVGVDDLAAIRGDEEGCGVGVRAVSPGDLNGRDGFRCRGEAWVLDGSLRERRKERGRRRKQREQPASGNARGFNILL